jgi:hypothetical protein
MTIKEAEKSIERMKKDIQSLESFIKENKIDIFSVTTYSEVCKQLGEEELNINHINHYFKNPIELLKAAQRDQIRRFFNKQEDGSIWEPDWINKNQRKYYPIWDKSSGSMAFCGVYCSYYCFIGGAVYYKTEDIARHVGKHFSEFY